MPSEGGARSGDAVGAGSSAGRGRGPGRRRGAERRKGWAVKFRRLMRGSVCGRGQAGDRGSATVWVVCVIGALCAVFGVLLAQGEAVLVRHRAAGAADLAALAAADHWMRAEEEACATARRVAGAQGSRLVRCAVVGEVSDVTAASVSGPFTSEVRARAGPPGSSDPEAPTGPKAPGGSPTRTRPVSPVSPVPPALPVPTAPKAAIASSDP
jgi:secretion/DNA translocation related TadE-like protein